MAVSLPSARPDGRAYAIAGALDVWSVDLTQASDTGLTGLLCARERARAAQIVGAHRRALWTRSRAVLRGLLARYLNADPRRLVFEYGEHGKPRLHTRSGNAIGPTGAALDLRFNLSHSGQLMLVAVTAGREVGVDVERIRKPHTAESLRAWTVREARVKCLGVGLGATPTIGDHAPEEIWTAALDIGPRALAAVALTGAQEGELRLLDWSS